jgi:hypothetical protein
VQTQPNWTRFLQNIPGKLSPVQIAQFMLEPRLSKGIIDELNKAADSRSAVMQIVSTPEYQLC